MAKFELTQSADRDLTEIYAYSFHQFGERQADEYLQSLRDCFALLAEMPTLGRSIDYFRTGYQRFEHKSHSVFYVSIDDGIRIMRVLHQRMDPERHL